MDPDTAESVARGSNPDLAGTVSAVFAESIFPPATLRGLDDGEGVWAECTVLNSAAETESAKRSWIVAHGDYLFGADYCP